MPPFGISLHCGLNRVKKDVYKKHVFGENICHGEKMEQVVYC
jgi:hypothetical protein